MLRERNIISVYQRLSAFIRGFRNDCGVIGGSGTMRTLLLTLALCLFVLPAQAKYSGGSGAADDPYQIATAADLISLGETPADYDKHFLLTADIDLDPKLPGRKVFDKAVIAPPASLDERGSFQGTAFAGVLDGNGHTISHVTIEGRDYLGLFGQLAPPAEVKKLGVVDANITGSGHSVGGLVGRNGSTVTHCYSTGTVSGKEEVGGLVGWNSGTVTQCYSTGAVIGAGDDAGGLVGHNSGSLTDCYSTGAVSGSSQSGWWDEGVGGLVGGNGSRDNKDAVVTRCYSAGAVTGTGPYVGGLAGSNGGTVTASLWDIQTSGQTKSGGGTGKTTAEMKDPNTFKAAGWGFTPHDIWFEPEGGGYPILWWQLSPWPSLPRFSGGTGERNDPYVISTSKDLSSIGYNPRLIKSHFKMVADLDLTGFHFYPIGNADYPYGGVFDGNGHTISHLTITGESSMGLFGRLGYGAEVKDLGVVDVNIASSGNYAGGLVGLNYGTVTQCYSTGTVSGRDYVGGLVGFNGEYRVQQGSITGCYSTGVVTGISFVGGLVGHNSSYCTVTRCYSTGAVSGTGQYSGVGGLVGWNDGDVTQCYSTGVVTGGYVGGLVGGNRGTVIQCYSTGAVNGIKRVGGLVGDASGGVVTVCFWDTHTSGQTKSAGGTGKTTAEMQTAKTFLDAGWDLVGETANGTEDIWWILEGKDYPRLTWEFWAFSPDPENGATDVIQSSTLSWLAARDAVAHDVYFGEDKTAVTNATPASPGIYCGRYARATTAYNPGVLDWAKTYYWRVDEINEASSNSPWKGNVWRFTTVDFIVFASVVDDFESYTDNMGAGQAIFQTWLDGLGYWSDPNDPNDPPAYAGNGTGSGAGNSQTPFAERDIVHGGKQSMPMDYNNVKKPWYSEADRTWATPQDWMTGGAETLTLYFRGKANNGRQLLYVGIEDSVGRIAVVVHPDAEAVRATVWQKWHIALAEVHAAGVDVAAVKKMVIGVGDRKNPKPGGTGRIYIDDIRLTKRMP
jgi:hypothetical protein